MTLFFICPMLQTTPAAWAASRPVPQIAGLTLGMTSDDALAALKMHSINATAVMNHWCMADFLVDQVHPYQGRGHCVQLITARYLGGDLLVFFTEDIPARPGVAVLTTIALNYPPQSALEPLIGQLGEPSLTDGCTRRS